MYPSLSSLFRGNHLYWLGAFICLLLFTVLTYFFFYAVYWLILPAFCLYIKKFLLYICSVTLLFLLWVITFHCHIVLYNILQFVHSTVGKYLGCLLFFIMSSGTVLWIFLYMVCMWTNFLRYIKCNYIPPTLLGNAKLFSKMIMLIYTTTSTAWLLPWWLRQ